MKPSQMQTLRAGGPLLETYWAPARRGQTPSATSRCGMRTTPRSSTRTEQCAVILRMPRTWLQNLPQAASRRQSREWGQRCACSASAACRLRRQVCHRKGQTCHRARGSSTHKGCTQPAGHQEDQAPCTYRRMCCIDTWIASKQQDKKDRRARGNDRLHCCGRGFIRPTIKAPQGFFAAWLSLV